MIEYVHKYVYKGPIPFLFSRNRLPSKAWAVFLIYTTFNTINKFPLFLVFSQFFNEFCIRLLLYPKLIPNNPKNHLNKKNIGTIKTAAPAPYFTQSSQPLNATPNLAFDIIVLLFFSTSLSSAFAVALKLSNLLPRLLLIFSSSSLIA